MTIIVEGRNCALAIFLPRGKPMALRVGGSAESALFGLLFWASKKVTGR
ncbi:hypothetical protein QNI19_32530 [Cytophagaceae bacterium DM2B3-1]|uniref:Uncharacterized protein n=1 Tax=Xanthocytophaga flava TaxID=3048013 RepID=A0ABT7CVE8_9BACT|nr:hypothetical protein [Xanthocytophaga flavus]MDJ1473234.1 hypothetical protein [Xanthocytophaga flavus]MDJ1497712.1 hypothetical protein [Xanthocytophaga flavus]